MKKILLLFIFISTLFLNGCSIEWNNENTFKKNKDLCNWKCEYSKDNLKKLFAQRLKLLFNRKILENEFIKIGKFVKPIIYIDLNTDDEDNITKFSSYYNLSLKKFVKFEKHSKFKYIKNKNKIKTKDEALEIFNKIIKNNLNFINMKNYKFDDISAPKERNHKYSWHISYKKYYKNYEIQHCGLTITIDLYGNIKKYNFSWFDINKPQNPKINISIENAKKIALDKIENDFLPNFYKKYKIISTPIYIKLKRTAGLFVNINDITYWKTQYLIPNSFMKNNYNGDNFTFAKQKKVNVELAYIFHVNLDYNSTISKNLYNMVFDSFFLQGKKNHWIRYNDKLRLTIYISTETGKLIGGFHNI